jgi:hypothetical protein
MSARSGMTMRAFIQRHSGAKDKLGAKGFSAVNWPDLATIPCYAFVKSGDTVHTPGLSADLTRYRARVPLGTDITSDDRIAKIQDRNGAQLFGLSDIDAVFRRSNHIELRLRNHE